jgi:hypothetical protein
MEKFILKPAFSAIENRPYQTTQFKQLFASLTGYDLMFEESRKDLTRSNTSIKSAKQPGQLLANYINKITVLFERKSCNNQL